MNLFQSQFSLNGFRVTYIDEEADLNKAVRQLRKCQELALDLEFDRNRYRYGFNLCLIQVAGGKDCYIIDPIPLSNKQLEPLWALFRDPSVTKIMHSASEDITLLKRCGCALKGLYDTSMASRVCGVENISYRAVLSENLGVEIDKKHQTSNWNTRPLQATQIQYAAADVVYLAQLRDIIVDNVKKVGREHWQEEECRVLETLEYHESPEAYLRLKEVSKLPEFNKYLLKYLYAFRDEMGKRSNKPPANVINNHTLVSLAGDPEGIMANWKRTKGVYHILRDGEQKDRIQAIIDKAAAEAEEMGLNKVLVRRRPTREDLARRDHIRKVRTALAPIKEKLTKQYEKAAALLFSNTYIDQIAKQGNMDNMPQYAIRIVEETAADLGIDLNEFLVEVPS